MAQDGRSTGEPYRSTLVSVLSARHDLAALAGATINVPTGYIVPAKVPKARGREALVLFDGSPAGTFDAAHARGRKGV
jgi:hypothetical protein